MPRRAKKRSLKRTRYPERPKNRYLDQIAPQVKTKLTPYQHGVRDANALVREGVKRRRMTNEQFAKTIAEQTLLDINMNYRPYGPIHGTPTSKDILANREYAEGKARALEEIYKKGKFLNVYPKKRRTHR